MKNKLAFLDKKINLIENIFTVIFLIYGIMNCCGITFGKAIIKPFMYGSILLAAVILLYRVISIKSYAKIPQALLAVLPVAAIGLSTLLNREYSFKENVIFCIYWAFYFLILFITKKDRSAKECKTALFVTGTAFCVYASLFALIALVMYFTGVSRLIVVGSTEICLGFRWGRLWGLFINPNIGAVACAVTILFLVFAFGRAKKVWQKVLLGIDMFICFAYIVLSDSRSGAVVLTFGIGAYVLVVLLCRFRGEKIFKSLLSVVLAGVIALGGFFAVRLVRKPVNYIIEHVEIENGDNEDDKNIDLTIDRGYDLSDDVSNRRFDVWKSGIELFTHSGKKMLFGLSFCGFTDYAKDNMPDTYIVNNDYQNMITLDNDILNIMVSNGIFGLLAAAAFVIYILVFVIKKFKTIKKEDAPMAAVVIAMLFALSCAAMFSSVMFYRFSPVAILFWAVLGQFMSYLEIGDNNKNEL